MKVIRLIFMIALAMTLTITLITMKNSTDQESVMKKKKNSDSGREAMPGKLPMPSKRLSRFLAEKPKNPRAADHCHKDNGICDLVLGEEVRRNSTCCNNKCVDLIHDAHNCGACKKKCLMPFESCCRGECVNLSYDKRHCGFCNNRCMPGGYCIYGICDYA